MDPRRVDPRIVIDAALELSVVGSFSRVGPAVRRRLFHWEPPPSDALRGRTVAITGPTSGLGLEVAREVAALGARVVLIGRDAERLGAVRAELVRAEPAGADGEDRFPTVVADMADLASVRSAAGAILASEDRLDVLVDNAGAIFPERRETADGIEATMALLVVGPFVLTSELLPLLRRTERSRVIAVTSGGMYTQAVPLDDLEWRGPGYEGPRAYARAKRTQVALMREWARRAREACLGVSFSAMHPGWAATPGLAASLPAFHRMMGPLLRSPAEGVDTTVWLAASAEPGTIDGRLFLDRRSRPFDRLPSTRLSAADRRRLWRSIVALSGGTDPLPEPDGSGRHAAR